MNEKLSQETITQALDGGYEKVLDGCARLDSAKELANGYIKGETDTWGQANSLITWQITIGETTVVHAALGDDKTLPDTLPENVSDTSKSQKTGWKIWYIFN